MKNNLTNKFFSAFNYKTNKNIFDISVISSYTIFNIGLFVPQSNTILPIELASLIILLYFLINDDKKYLSKDITEVKKLYEEFIINYNKLNTKFELSNPIEIFTLYNFLYKNGYLSKDKTFVKNNLNVCDIQPIMGANVLMGNGVCRHISTLFTDILNNNQINANNIGCHIETPVFDAEIVKKEDFSIDDTLKTLETLSKYFKDEYEKAIYYFNALYNNGEYLNMSFIPLENKKIKRSNHLITIAQKEDINYFLDPTKEEIYKLDNKTLYDNFGLPVKINKIYTFGYEAIRNIYNKNSTSTEEENKLINNTRKICENNIDVFDSFYKENKELYNDITNKLVRIKK